MVNIVGWTPTSRAGDPNQNLNEFISIFDEETTDQNYPLKRSGHRCFTDNDYLYVIGGYCTEDFIDGRILKELWAMSLMTFEWRRYQIQGDFPERLASFALIQLAPYSKQIIIFGGSSTAFGISSSNSLHLIQVNNEDCMATSRKLTVEGEAPQPMYGHAMCAGEIPGKYYIIGGTEGNIFNFNVTSVTMKLNPKADSDDKYTWHYEQVSNNENYPGRYRLEAVYDDKKNCLLFFGGGNTEQVFGFDKIITHNVNTCRSGELSTVPDPTDGFPSPRRCHTLVRQGRNVIITGGVSHHRIRGPPHFSDVWIFNLDSLTWKKCQYSLPKAVFFHDSVMTKEGWLLSFGGVHGLEATAPRNNMLIGSWFGVPSLQSFATESLRKTYPEMFSGLYCGNFRQSAVIETIMAFARKETIKEKERQIMEAGKIKFHEGVDRKRHYQNENAKKFMVTVQLDKMQWERRDRDGIPVFLERSTPSEVREAMKLLIEHRKQLGECEIGSEIDKLKIIWDIVGEHDEGAVQRRRARRQQLLLLQRRLEEDFQAAEVPIVPGVRRNVMDLFRRAGARDIFNNLLAANPMPGERDSGDEDSDESDDDVMIVEVIDGNGPQAAEQ